VSVSGRVLDKAGSLVSADATIDVKERPRFVSRAGEKLAGALQTFPIEVEGVHALDVGASTGGFVDSLLAAGALEVIALDVGHGQLDMRLRSDPRVHVLERVNARYLTPDQLPYAPDLLTMDVSFISVTKVLPAVIACMSPTFQGIVLIKPQFEAGPREVGKRGVVRDPAVHKKVLTQTARAVIGAMDAELLGMCRSGYPGSGGNVEFFFYIARGREKGIALDRLDSSIEECIPWRSPAESESER
jgi:23S rRNA (cytidine1920-2'-O)/16S rRNA (cytidine1409-2'-O)-methyltransferase